MDLRTSRPDEPLHDPCDTQVSSLLRRVPRCHRAATEEAYPVFFGFSRTESVRAGHWLWCAGRFIVHAVRWELDRAPSVLVRGVLRFGLALSRHCALARRQGGLGVCVSRFPFTCSQHSPNVHMFPTFTQSSCRRC